MIARIPVQTVISIRIDFVSKLNPQNERIKRDYVRFLKEARGKSEATLDATRKALARFADYTGARASRPFAANKPSALKTGWPRPAVNAQARRLAAQRKRARLPP
jgi:hypothetical protein